MTAKTAKELQQRIEARQATVGVIGLGYVGLPLLLTFHDAGFPVLGFDVDPAKTDALKAGRSYIQIQQEDMIAAAAKSDRFDATADMSRLGEADAVLICVPTPLGQHHEPDLGFVESTARAIAATLRPGQLVVLESTTYPSTTSQVVKPILDDASTRDGKTLACGEDYFLAYSPEREDPGRKSHSTKTIPKLVGGVDTVSGELAAGLYQHAVDEVVQVSSATVAEAAKLLENIYRAVNIALVNELKVVLTEMDVDVWEVIEAAATKPFGFQPFYPGPGLGGHCIPIDPFYLTWKAREVGQATRFIELAGEVNRAMPSYVVSRTMAGLNDAGKAVRGSRILVLGIAYKPDVDDMRESPAFELIERFMGLGAEVDYHDPHVPHTPRKREYDLRLSSIELSPQAIASYDCVVIATHHKAFDWPTIVEHAKMVIDTRGVTRGLHHGGKVVTA